ncbi:MAG: chorismate synthase [Candidatus Omnitrophota bacterium]
MLRYLTAGESHGKALVAILEGMPAGLKIEEDFINTELSRRQRGYGRGKRMEIEQDRIEIISGLRKSKTIGSPIALLIKNRDYSIERLNSLTKPRPGHADLAGALKYGFDDVRNVLERASARETAVRVAVGASCKILLDEFGIEVMSHVLCIGGIEAHLFGISLEELKRRSRRSPVGCADENAAKLMMKRIETMRERGDSLGGTFEVIAKNVPPGLGTYAQSDLRLDSRIAGALVSIHGVKGAEIGNALIGARVPGSQFHDEIFYRKGKGFYRKTNNAGGIEGGVSNGEIILARAFMKPISTLSSPLSSVDIKTKKQFKASVERHDICAVPAAGVIGEAVLAFEIAKAMREKFAGDSVLEMKRNYHGYLRQLAK